MATLLIALGVISGGCVTVNLSAITAPIGPIATKEDVTELVALFPAKSSLSPDELLHYSGLKDRLVNSVSYTLEADRKLR